MNSKKAKAFKRIAKRFAIEQGNIGAAKQIYKELKTNIKTKPSIKRA